MAGTALPRSGDKNRLGAEERYQACPAPFTSNNTGRRKNYAKLVSFEHHGFDFDGGVGLRQNRPLQSQAGDGQGQPLAEAKPAQVRFTKADNGVITDRVTGLDWFVGPNPDNNWHQAKAWAENLTMAGGGWRLPTRPELKALYQKGASRNNMDPIFQAPGAWVWSGELHNAWSAWGFAFYSGLENSHGLDYAYGRLALAVRSHR